ncbi:MAG: helicase C-terminal domain-containing protein [Anaerolineae bacterium]
MEGSKPSRLQANVTEIALRAQQRRARRLLHRGDLVGAIRVYQEILALAPDVAWPYYQLGLCHRQREAWEEADVAFARAAQLGDERAMTALDDLRAFLRTQRSPTKPAEVDPDSDEDPMASDPAVVVGGEVISGSPRWHPDDEMTYEPTAEGRRILEPSGLYRTGGAAGNGGVSDEQTTYRPITCPPLDDVFAPGGPLAQALGHQYRARPGQVRMAALVREALQSRRHAVLEAGTGVGKSFAYLIPILWSGTPAVVSTSNKGLMNQLWESDIPRLKEIAPRPITAALLKGRNNYVCRLRLDRLRQQVGLAGLEQALALVREGLAAVPSGDMEVMRLPPDLAARLTVGARECRGRHCAHYDTCFYEKAKQAAAEADVVVTNHAMLCHNALLYENHILPVRPVLIIDEAHQLARYAVEALTKTLGQDQFWGLLNTPAVREATTEPELLGDLHVQYEDFFRAADKQRPGSPRSPRRPTRWALAGELQAGLALWESLRKLHQTLSHARTIADGDREAALMQAGEVAETARVLAVPEPETHIRLCETEEEAGVGTLDAYHALYRPLEVSSPLKRMLFNIWPRVICTSATLSVGDDLGWFRRQVGLFSDNGAVISETLPGPFDYAHQMLLYTPQRLVPVYDEERQAFASGYVSELTDEVLRLLEASRGRALVLCTSRARMTQLYDTLAPVLRGRYPCYLQGEYAQPELVARFKADGDAILFATRGFWEGLDIPGDALALVILDKIPFVPFNDPIIQRQEAQILQRGGNPFYEIQLGNAILSLRQGAGRLIRTETDRGVIALLDGRILRKRYGRQIIQSLPEGCHTTAFEDVATFLSGQERE